MARPKKSAAELRDRVYVLRLTSEERAAMEDRASAYGLPLADYLRKRALGHPLPARRAERVADAALTTALLRLGVNLNQIARQLNRGEPPGAELPALITAIATHLESLSHDPGRDRQGPQLQGTGDLSALRQSR